MRLGHVLPTATVRLLRAAVAGTEIWQYKAQAHRVGIAGLRGTCRAGIFDSRIRPEQRAHHAPRPRRQRIAVRIAVHRDEIARFGGQGRCKTPERCVQQEEAATANRPSFSY